MFVTADIAMCLELPLAIVIFVSSDDLSLAEDNMSCTTVDYTNGLGVKGLTDDTDAIYSDDPNGSN